MLTPYITAALRKAHYEMLPDGEGYFGTIADIAGVWAQAIRWKPVERNYAKFWKSGSC